MKSLHMVAFLLVIVGGVAWGLVGLMNLNIVEMIVGGGTLAKLIYIVVGASAVYLALTHKDDCKNCSRK